MRLLTIDVGAGTQDILLYDSNIEIANAVKMVLPSEPKLLASKVQMLTQQKKNIVVYGETMGGYPFSSALKKHIAAGLKVKMTPTAARSIRDDFDIVKAMNIVNTTISKMKVAVSGIRQYAIKATVTIKNLKWKRKE